ncbi:MAG TPA: hypothetical protein VE153_23045 [Myxococcus sp.]|jgi:hypothetical protein|nr:hypothetical protein [Myxococcus sp.]
MDEFRIPKRRVHARFTLTGGASREVALFLAQTSPEHGGPERLSDLLNGGVAFIPALDLATDRMLFVNRLGLMVAWLSAEDEKDTVDQLTIPTEHEVEIHLTDGQVVRGLVTYVLPESHSRLTDFLNEAAPFFRLLELEGGVALINKHHVAYVESLTR